MSGDVYRVEDGAHSEELFAVRLNIGTYCLLGTFIVVLLCDTEQAFLTSHAGGQVTTFGRAFTNLRSALMTSVSFGPGV